MRYVSLQDPEIASHLDRHFAGSANPGSKFLPMTEEARVALLESVDAAVRGRFDEMVAKGDTPDRVILQIDAGRPVGTDALVSLAGLAPDAACATVVRDRGTAFETPVNVVVTAPSAMPRTGTITVIAGPDRDGESFGLWTMFPGGLAPAFPNPARQTPEQVAESQVFWDGHAFLATPNEILATDPQGPGVEAALHRWYGATGPGGRVRLDGEGAVRCETALPAGPDEGETSYALNCARRPALIRADGTEEWYRDGERHRSGDQPALVRPTADGGHIAMHYVHGKLERDPEIGPAVAVFDAAGNEREDRRVYAAGGERVDPSAGPAARPGR